MKGRKEIARFARVSTGVLDQMLDRGMIPIWRAGQGPQGTIFSSTRMILEALENSAKRRSKREI